MNFYSFRIKNKFNLEIWTFFVKSRDWNSKNCVDDVFQIVYSFLLLFDLEKIAWKDFPKIREAFQSWNNNVNNKSVINTRTCGYHVLILIFTASQFLIARYDSDDAAFIWMQINGDFSSLRVWVTHIRSYLTSRLVVGPPFRTLRTLYCCSFK